MRFLQSIISKTAEPELNAPLRRSHETIAERLRNAPAAEVDEAEETPRFSRSTKRIVRTPALAVDSDAPLSEILDQWKKDRDRVSPNECEAVAPKTPARRVERVKTRLLGFDDVTTPEPFEAAKPANTAAPTRYPVGWLVVTDGPGRGASFTLLSGMSQIGRGEDQAIALDFGDEAISRSNHAAIVYDIETHEFMLGHGGKANIVRLNDAPLITTETLKSGDMIRIGETCLQLVVFSTPEFNWATAE